MYWFFLPLLLNILGSEVGHVMVDPLVIGFNCKFVSILLIMWKWSKSLLDPSSSHMSDLWSFCRSKFLKFFSLQFINYFKKNL